MLGHGRHVGSGPGRRAPPRRIAWAGRSATPDRACHDTRHGAPHRIRSERLRGPPPRRRRPPRRGRSTAFPVPTSWIGPATPSHNRSVFTLAGEVGAVSDALERLVAVALDEIDMDAADRRAPADRRRRRGAVRAPRETTMDECIAFAREFGRRIAARFDLPVYLYAAAAARPDRVRLADVRRGQYEGLRDEIATRGPRARLRAGPDAPARWCDGGRRAAVPHRLEHQPRLGRPRPRQADRRTGSASRRGGLPAVQAKGFWIEELGCAQVSMNLLDFARTPMWRAWEAVRGEAADGRRRAPRDRS